MNKVKGNILFKSLSLIPNDQYGLFFKIVLDVHKNMKNTPPNFKNLQEELKIMSSQWDQAFLRG